MKSIYKICLMSGMLVLLTGCATGHSKFYKEFPKKNPDSLVYLTDGEEPQVYSTDDMNRDVKKMMAKRYVPIGASSFNGELEDKDSVISQAKQVKAVAALYTWKYVNTQTSSGVLTMPQTNYFSGTVNTFGSGGTGFSTFNGSTTGMVSTPYSITQTRYDQEAVYFAKNPNKGKFGFFLVELTRDQRINLGKYGLLIDNIFEDSPAYKSDLLIGDIIVEFDKKPIENRQKFDDLIKNFDILKGSCELKVIRNNEEKTVIIKFA